MQRIYYIGILLFGLIIWHQNGAIGNTSECHNDLIKKLFSPRDVVSGKSYVFDTIRQRLLQSVLREEEKKAIFARLSQPGSSIIDPVIALLPGYLQTEGTYLRIGELLSIFVRMPLVWQNYYWRHIFPYVIEDFASDSVNMHTYLQGVWPMTPLTRWRMQQWYFYSHPHIVSFRYWPLVQHMHPHWFLRSDGSGEALIMPEDQAIYIDIVPTILTPARYALVDAATSVLFQCCFEVRTGVTRWIAQQFPDILDDSELLSRIYEFYLFMVSHQEASNVFGATMGHEVHSPFWEMIRMLLRTGEVSDAEIRKMFGVHILGFLKGENRRLFLQRHFIQQMNYPLNSEISRRILGIKIIPALDTFVRLGLGHLRTRWD